MISSNPQRQESLRNACCGIKADSKRDAIVYKSPEVL